MAHQATWHLKLLTKQSTVAHQLTFGLLESYCLLCYADAFPTEVLLIRNFIRRFRMLITKSLLKFLYY